MFASVEARVSLEMKTLSKHCPDKWIDWLYWSYAEATMDTKLNTLRYLNMKICKGCGLRTR
jgi:Pyruvate/2-oxoacid:ferredoxin oxidoreductase delta subunit